MRLRLAALQARASLPATLHLADAVDDLEHAPQEASATESTALSILNKAILLRSMRQQLAQGQVDEVQYCS